MKKVSLLIIASLLASLCIALPALATPRLAQAQQPQKGFKTPEERAAYEAYYKEQADWAKKLTMGKEFLSKYTDSDWKTDVKKGNLNALWNLFNAAVTAFGQGTPDAAKLEPVLSLGEEYRRLYADLGLEPENLLVVSQMALKAGYGLMFGFYKDTDKTRSYAEKSLQLLGSETPPKGWETGESAKYYTNFRAGSLGYFNQYIGLTYLRQSTPDPEQAIAYLTKAAENKSWATAKDPNTYLLRAEATNLIYDKLSAEYRNLPPEKKTEQEGKDALAKVDPVVDKMIDDYARAVALLSDPSAKDQQAVAKERLTDFYKYRYGKTEGIDALIKYYQADPTAAPMVIKVSSDDAAHAELPKAEAGKIDAAKATDAKTGSKAAASKTTAKPPVKKKKGK